MTAFHTINLYLFANLKKNYFKDWVSESQFKIEYFYHLLEVKSVWKNPGYILKFLNCTLKIKI